jgi:predicted anti-sigma-YlaC factor YlaD
MKNPCDQIREALSARLDGEETGVPAGALEAHLATCRDCAGWLAGAEEVTRAVRVHAIEAPDLTAQILAAVSADAADLSSQVRRRSRRSLMRLALGLTAVLQLAMALPILLGLGDIAHISREAASFDIAVAVGFALAAWRPGLARAFEPVAFVLAGCLMLSSALDIMEGAARLAHETSHVAALVQAALLWGLSRDNGPVLPRSRRETATS